MRLESRPEHEITFWQPHVREEEVLRVLQVLRSQYLNEGDVTREFEQDLATRLGCAHVVTATSGTAALFLALKALGIGAGDEVIVPDVTFIATANAVAMTGAAPVLVDVDPVTLNMDPAAAARAVNARTRGIVPVHVSGRAADLDALGELARARGLHLVEDAAEAFMSRRRDGKCLGTVARAGILSFSPNKTITTGQGGAVLTSDRSLALRVREMKDQGRPQRGTGGADVHDSIGFNFKFTNLQAAVGLGQMMDLDRRVRRLRDFYLLYRRGLAGVPGVRLLRFDVDGGECPQWIDAVFERRDACFDYLGSLGIHCRPYWYPLHRQRPYRQADDRFPVSSRLADRAMWLPSDVDLADDDIKLVCDRVREHASLEIAEAGALVPA